MSEAKVVAIAAIGRNRELGRGNELLWRIPEDLKRFKRLSENHPLILGRKTYDSIIGYAGKPLPKRTHIVVSRFQILPGEGYGHSLFEESVIFVPDIESALEKAKELDKEWITIGGGAQIYKLALPHVTRLCLTIIDEAKEADSFFPEYEQDFPKILHEERHEFEGLSYRFVDLERVG